MGVRRMQVDLKARPVKIAHLFSKILFPEIKLIKKQWIYFVKIYYNCHMVLGMGGD